MEDDQKPRPSTKASTLDAQRFIRRVDWNLFRIFHEIVQCGSLSAAARRLNMHQPSLSAALKRLEEHLGVTLCHRTSRGIDLTPAGKALMQLSVDMIDTIRLAPHLTSQVAHRIEGTLLIKMVSNIISAELDEALASFHRRHPAVEITIEVSPWRDVLEALSSNECDIGVSHDNEPRPNLQYHPMFPETHQAYCGRSHHLFGVRVREPESLAQERFILTGRDEPEDLVRFRQRYGLGENPAGHAPDLHEASRLIELGMGIGFLPTLVAEQLKGKRLWPILPSSVLPSYLIYLIAPPASRMSTPGQLFLDEIRRRLWAKEDLV